jgi:Domain of unknown function (DUF1735)
MNRKYNKMKRISLKNSWLVASIVVLSACSLSSCLKDTGPVQDFGKSPALVSFQYTGSASQDMVTSVLPNPDDSVGVEVTLSVSSGTLTTPVTVTLALDPDSLATYNAVNGTSYTMLDPAFYTTPANMQVTIAAGQHIVPFVLHLKGSTIDYSTDPILIFKIASATGATIATNLSVIVLPIKLRNPYEGAYTVTGYFVHPSSPRALNLNKSLSTISAIESRGLVGDLGSTFTFDVSPTNTLVNFQSAVNANSGFINGVDNAVGDPNYPGPPFVHTTYNNTYDPATGIFWMHYGYNGVPPVNFTREIYEEWVPQ